MVCFIISDITNTTNKLEKKKANYKSIHYHTVSDGLLELLQLIPENELSSMNEQ